MNGRSYTLAPDEKASQVMLGTSDALIWGDLVTKEQVRMSVYLGTLADEFVPLHDAKILFFATTQQTPPLERPTLFVKLEEILIFFEMHDSEPLPEETEMRRYEPIEVLIGSFQIEGKIIKAPVSTFLNTLLVSRATYIPLYEATIRHIAKPWLGTFSGNIVQVRRERMLAALR
jgi:hypothetical protein